MELKPGYKKTEVGMIPEEWDVKPLRSVISKGRLGGNYANQDKEAEFPLMKMGNIARGYFDMSKVEFITPGVTPERAHQLTYGDVLFNTRNTLDLVGKVAVWRDELPVAYYNSNLMRLEFDPKQVCSNEYANYALNTANAIARLRALATGTTSVAAIYTRDLMELLFVVPPLIEQRAIAEALSDVDALLGRLDQLITKKCDLKQAAMQQLLTGQTRLPGFHGESGMKLGYKRTEVGVIPEDWEVSTVGQEFEVKLGKMLDAEKNVGILKPYLGNKAVQWNRIDINGLPTVRMTRTDIERFRLRKGDVLVCEGGEIGRAALWDAPIEECYYQKALHRLRPIHGFDSRLMVSLLRLWADRGLLANYVTQTSIAHLPREKFMEVPLPVPPLPEQRAIAAALSDMDAEITALEQRREKTRALKQAMMQELLTGKTRLVAAGVSHA